MTKSLNKSITEIFHENICKVIYDASGSLVEYIKSKDPSSTVTRADILQFYMEKNYISVNYMKEIIELDSKQIKKISNDGIPVTTNNKEEDEPNSSNSNCVNSQICKHRIIRGKNKGTQCSTKTKSPDGYCSKHKKEKVEEDIV